MKNIISKIRGKVSDLMIRNISSKFKNMGDKKMTSLIITSVAVAAAAIVGVASYLMTGEEDNPIEESAESFIEKQIGYDVDLSPSSPEKPKK